MPHQPRRASVRFSSLWPHASLALVLHSILRLTDVFTHDVEVIFAIDTFPITTNGPDGPIAENRPLLADTARTIRLQLIANGLARIPDRRYDGMNMIRTSTNCPQVPIPVIAMSLTLPLGDRALLR